MPIDCRKNSNDEMSFRYSVQSNIDNNTIQRLSEDICKEMIKNVFINLKQLECSFCNDIINYK